LDDDDDLYIKALLAEPGAANLSDLDEYDEAYIEAFLAEPVAPASRVVPTAPTLNEDDDDESYIKALLAEPAAADLSDSDEYDESVIEALLAVPVSRVVPTAPVWYVVPHGPALPALSNFDEFLASFFLEEDESLSGVPAAPTVDDEEDLLAGEDEYSFRSDFVMLTT
jgi:hypothetical protein